MPLSSETIPNRPLSGKELAEVIVKDLLDLLARDGLFSSCVAFGRISYEVEVRLHLDNINYPEHVAKRTSSGGYPLSTPSKDALSVGHSRTRTITSPNVARIENGIPVKTVVKVGDHLETREILYTQDDLPVQGPAPTDRDTSSQLAQKVREIAAGRGKETNL